MRVSVKCTTWPNRKGIVFVTRSKRFLHGAYTVHRDKRTGLYYMLPGDEWSLSLKLLHDDNFELGA